VPALVTVDSTPVVVGSERDERVGEIFLRRYERVSPPGSRVEVHLLDHERTSMATIEKYQTGSGATHYRVRYRTPDKRQTDKRGFRTKRDAEAWANQLEVDKRRGAYLAPAAGRVQLGSMHGSGWSRNTS
jgi:hypothetical protein